MNILNGLLKGKILEGTEQTIKQPLIVHNRVAPGPGLKIPFKPSDPQSLDSYLGQEGVKKRIVLRLNNFKRGDVFKALFSAPAGIGKTALARIIAKLMADKGFVDNYYEVVASKFEDKAALDVFIRNLQPYSVIMIDEVHGLTNAVRDALLPVLQDGVYAFGDSLTMQPLPVGISWLAATTDVGQVHAAVQRRFTVFHLEPMSPEDRFILAFSLVQKKFEESALREVAKRCWTPWEIKDEAMVVIHDLAESIRTNTVDKNLVEHAFNILGVDENGLRFREIEVLKSLYNSKKIIGGINRYVMSASALMSSAGVDKKAFYGYIEPKLLRTGFMTVSSSGRELTDKALESYF